jgi:hypothetical protein
MTRFSKFLTTAAVGLSTLALAATANASTITVHPSSPASISSSATYGAVVICDGAVQGNGLCGAPDDTTLISAYAYFGGGAATIFEDALYQYDLPENTVYFAQIAFLDGSFGLDYTPGDGDPGDDGQGTSYHIITQEAVPEPGTIALLGLGLLGIGARRRRA